MIFSFLLPSAVATAGHHQVIAWERDCHSQPIRIGAWEL
jgi:hypothetical protein